MAYDVASSISELLLENNSVIVPGFGGFMLNYKPASIDHVQSVISPPAKVASFNKNLVINDGVLVNYIKNQNRCTLEQAKKIVDDYVEEIQAKIGKKEIIDFPEVGRLYKDYTEKIQFLPHDTNFNTSVFGLPTVKFQPIHRRPESQPKKVAHFKPTTEKVVTPPPPTVSVTDDIPRLIEEEITEKKSDTQTRKAFKWAQWAMPALIVASLLIVIASIYLMTRQNGNATGEDGSPLSVTERVNQKPSYEEATLIDGTQDGTTQDEPTQDEMLNELGLSEDQYDDTDKYQPDASTDGEIESKANAAGSEKKDCIIIVGQFGAKANANKLAAKIEKQGYKAFMGWNTEQGWNMVGIQFDYSTEGEKRKMLRKLRKKYDEAAWVYDGPR